jgi:hypothetical protein
MTDLQMSLEARIKDLSWQGKRNYLFAYILYAAAGLASAAATIWTAALAATKAPPNVLLVVLAAVPGATMILNESLRPELKAKWCYNKKAALVALLRQSQFAARPDEQVVTDWNNLDSKMEADWPAFGSIAGKPSLVSTKRPK